MLKERDCTGKTGSIYECDMCGKVLYSKKDRRFILSFTDKNIDKTKGMGKLDLCHYCYKRLIRSIGHFRNKKDKENEK